MNTIQNNQEEYDNIDNTQNILSDYLFNELNEEDRIELQNSIHALAEKLIFPRAVTYGRNTYLESHLKRIGFTHLAYSGQTKNERVRQARGGLTFGEL